MVELKYKLNRQMLGEGANVNYMKCYLKWHIFNIVMGTFFLILGTYFALQLRKYEILPYVLIGCGVTILLKKRLYIRRVVKNVFDGKPEEQLVHCKFDNSEIWMKTNNAEGTTQWSGIYDCIVTENGILLYPQKGIHQWLPRNAEFITGSWQDLVDIVTPFRRKKK